jgi:hypothetical protein
MPAYPIALSLKSLEELAGARCKWIKGFRYYAVCENGSVWSCAAPGTSFKPKPWHRLRPGANRKGYLQVNLWRRGKGYMRFVHKLVLAAFKGKQRRGQKSRHFPDRNVLNNAASNLLWGSALENAADQRFHGTAVRGERVGTAKLTESQVRQLYADLRDNPTLSFTEAGKRLGIGRKHAADIARGRRWQHLGLPPIRHLGVT